MHSLIFISAKGCKDCLRMKKCLDELIKNKEIKIEQYDSEDEKAIDIAIEYNINDVPGCRIGKISIFGKDFKEKDIIGAFEEFEKQRNTNNIRI